MHFARITRMRLNQSFTSSFLAVATCATRMGLPKSDRVMHFSFSQVRRIIWNAGDEDFVYYVIADNPRSGGSGRVIPVIIPTAENGQ